MKTINLLTQTINNNVFTVEPSASITNMAKARALKKLGNDIVDLSAGEPDFNTPEKVTRVCIDAILNGRTHYSEGRGLDTFREKIAEKLQRENGILCDKKNIIVTPGAKYAIYAAVTTLINNGDEILYFDPSWVSYKQIILLAGGKPVAVQLNYDDGYLITRDKILHAITKKSKAIIINTPNNPTGRMLSVSEVQILKGIVSEFGLYVIADEIYEKISFGEKHISLGSVPEIANRVITINGLSKCMAMTGWRLGYLVGPQEIVDYIYLLYQHTMTCVSEFSQIAGIVALDCLDEMEAMRVQYENRVKMFCGLVNSIPGVDCRMPEGAFYAWMRIKKDNFNSSELADFLLEKAGVVVVAGSAYSTERVPCIRASVATTMENLKIAAFRMEKALKNDSYYDK